MEMIRGFEARLRDPGAAPLGEENPATPEPEVPPATIEEALKAAETLAARDAAVARDLARLGLRVHGENSEAQPLKDLIARLDAKTGDAKAEKPGARKSAEPVKGRAADVHFAGDSVHSYEIELSDEAIAKLKKEPKSPVKATFRCGDQVIHDVGVRLRGSIGTFQPLEGSNKPGFTVRFSEFVEGQEFHGLKKIILSNGQQSMGYLSDYLGYGLFRDAGLPAPRVTFAEVSVNDKPYGLYVEVEAITSRFLSNWFGDGSGDLYEGPGDISRADDLDVDSDPDAADRESLKALARAAEDVIDGDPLTKLDAFLDVQQLAKFLALEALLSHWDGYIATNNYRIYRDPATKKFSLIPHGADQVFGNAMTDPFQAGRGLLSRALLASEAGRAIYRAELASLLASVWDPPRVLERARRAYERIRPHLAADPRRPQTLSSLEERIHRMLTYLEERLRLAVWQLAAEKDPELAERLAKLVRGEGFGGPERRRQ